MYLHGDGGTCIYDADALDKTLEAAKGADIEAEHNITELRERLDEGLRFQVAITNPPFSMTKELRNETKKRILKQYDLARIPGTSDNRQSLRSNIMFIELYRDLLAPGGRLLTVIDDTLLAGNDPAGVRKFIREHFIVRAIVSLPGDAFKRSGARVKTSILCLDKKRRADERQAAVYTAFSQYLGVDDLTHRAWPEEAAAARMKAEEEIDRISDEFHRFLNGDPHVPAVAADRIADRLDLKHVVPLRGRFVNKWQAEGIEVKHLKDILEIRTEILWPRRDHSEEAFTVIQVSYAGFCEVQKQCKGANIKYDRMLRVYADDLLFSEIRASDGAIGIVPKHMDRALVSENFMVLRCGDDVDRIYL